MDTQSDTQSLFGDFVSFDDVLFVTILVTAFFLGKWHHGHSKGGKFTPTKVTVAPTTAQKVSGRATAAEVYESRAPKQRVETVKEFLASSNVSADVADFFLAERMEVQESVLAEGYMKGCRDQNSVLLSRITEGRKAAGLKLRRFPMKPAAAALAQDEEPPRALDAGSKKKLVASVMFILKQSAYRNESCIAGSRLGQILSEDVQMKDIAEAAKVAYGGKGSFYHRGGGWLRRLLLEEPAITIFEPTYPSFPEPRYQLTSFVDCSSKHTSLLTPQWIDAAVQPQAEKLLERCVSLLNNSAAGVIKLSLLLSTLMAELPTESCAVRATILTPRCWLRTLLRGHPRIRLVNFGDSDPAYCLSDCARAIAQDAPPTGTSSKPPTRNDPWDMLSDHMKHPPPQTTAEPAGAADAEQKTQPVDHRLRLRCRRVLTLLPRAGDRESIARYLHARLQGMTNANKAKGIAGLLEIADGNSVCTANFVNACRDVVREEDVELDPYLMLLLMRAHVHTGQPELSDELVQQLDLSLPESRKAWAESVVSRLPVDADDIATDDVCYMMLLRDELFAFSSDRLLKMLVAVVLASAYMRPRNRLAVLKATEGLLQERGVQMAPPLLQLVMQAYLKLPSRELGFADQKCSKKEEYDNLIKGAKSWDNRSNAADDE